MMNPWMSVWLSEYNRHAGAISGEIAAETSRQQQAMAKHWTGTITAMWMKTRVPWLPQEKGRRK